MNAKLLPLFTAALIFAAPAAVLNAGNADAPKGTPSSGQTVPGETVALHDKLAATLDSRIRTWTVLEAGSISKDPHATAFTVEADVQSRFAHSESTPQDIDAITLIVLVEAVQNMDHDILLLTKKGHGTETKTAASLKTALERRTDFLETLLVITKKITSAQNPAPQVAK